MRIEIVAERIFNFLGMPITNTLLTSWLVVIILLFLIYFLSRKINIIPSFLQNIFEFFVDSFLNLLEGIFGSRDVAAKYLPIVATIFIFILISNWLGILPGVGSIGFFEKYNGESIFVPLFRSAASDLNFTLALATMAVFLINFFGIAEVGLKNYLSKFFNLKSPIDFFTGILELISEISKIISFSFRLFGNIFAGEVLLAIMMFLVPYLIPTPFLFLEIFVGFIQALVFSLLTAVFISLAVVKHAH